MIKLHVPDKLAAGFTLSTRLGLAGLQLDLSFGRACEDFACPLQVVRTMSTVDDLPRRHQLSPETLEACGDIRNCPGGFRALWLGCGGE